MFSGCVGKLPPNVDYTIGENTKPEIDQPDAWFMDQVSFETKIEEIKAKIERFIVLDSDRASLIDRANELLTEQQECFLKNENKAHKAGLLSVFFTAIGLGTLVATTSKNEVSPSNDLNKMEFDVGFDNADPLYMFSRIALFCPLTYIIAYYIGNQIGKSSRNEKIKPEFNKELQALVNFYNRVIYEQANQ